MKKHILLILEVIIVTVFATIACYGSYLSHNYSITTENPEPLTEYIYVPVYIEKPVLVEVEKIEEAEIEEEEVFYRTFSAEDADLLEQIAMSEAANQGTVGMALVMMTVINRSEKTGDSIREVIFAPNQYATAGMCAGNDEAHEALALIESGWDESQGALYFRTKHYHIFGTPLFQYKDHYFSK
jgi:N-acetylmuramoyl-L-alanine amidase